MKNQGDTEVILLQEVNVTANRTNKSLLDLEPKIAPADNTGIEIPVLK